MSAELYMYSLIMLSTSKDVGISYLISDIDNLHLCWSLGSKVPPLSLFYLSEMRSVFFLYKSRTLTYTQQEKQGKVCLLHHLGSKSPYCTNFQNFNEQSFL